METYLNKGIKEVIDQFPEIENILNEYDIGCAPCSVGTCLLKDIVEIHYLPADKELQMMARITNAIYPGKEIKIPEIKSKPETKLHEIKYSPPMTMLVDEHVFIKKMAALIPELVTDLDTDSDEGRQLITDTVDFIRFYADKCHHAKEEDILFKYFDEDLDILKVMLLDHLQARSHVKAVLDGLEKCDKTAIAKHLTAYSKLLKEHIKKEDEILYPWMDRDLTTTQIGKLFAQFKAADATLGYSPSKYEDFIGRLENKFER